MYWEKKGAFTSAISADMLKEINVKDPQLKRKLEKATSHLEV